MAKKVVILNGSPRPKGNTAGLIEAFTRGAESAGHTVESFALDRMNIHSCKGCYGGGKNPASPCVQKDDMDQIYTAFAEADVVVMASPLYYWNFSGQLRTATDRLLAVSEGNPGLQMPKKESLLLMAAGGTPDDFKFIKSYYDMLMDALGWENKGAVLAANVNNLGDIAGKPELAQAEAMGATL